MADVNPPPQHQSPASFVQTLLATNPSDSKKWVMAVIGISALLFCFVFAAVIGLVRTALAPQMTALATVIIPSLAGIVGIYLGAQGAVEMKATGVLQTAQQNTNVEEHKTCDTTEHVIVEGAANAPDRKPFNPDALQ